MKKIDRLKIITSILIFIAGTIGSLYIVSYIHLLLIGEMINLEIIEFFQTIEIIKGHKNSMTLFIAFELLVILIGMIYFLSNDKFYQSELITITPDISIPVSAGQKQFGSARFMTEEERGELFNILTIKHDKTIKELINHGYDDVSALKGGDNN